ncbi:MAG: phosphatase PAP2 family protein [Pseudodonghicola sp.]|nr:phosphatase PAP2 family protein [Pseudodonghicola sp.]
MTFSLDQILPSLQALGVLGYWIIGLGSMLEAFFLTGVAVPGTLIVDAGGILVQRGLLDFFDLAWFVVIGSVLGSELGYWTGRLAIGRLPGRQRLQSSAAFARAWELFEKRGGAALVIGRFLGPVAGLVPLAAGIAGMGRRKFLVWNILSGIPYALAHVAIGYFLGDVIGRIGGSLTRVAVLVAVVGLLLIVLWGLLYSALRLLPLAWAVFSAALRNLADIPVIARRIAAHPKAARWVGARLDRTAFSGLPLSLLAVVFLYIGAVWVEAIVDFIAGDPLLQLDLRLAELIHHFQSPEPVRIATLITACGGWEVVLPVVAAVVAWMLLEGRSAFAMGLAVSLVGNTLSVALLKLAFGRPRSPLAVFTETSGSFPSGHAAASVAAYGMILYVIWRTGKLRAETALTLAGLVAFAIGVSRIYLIEHYLSDVLNGWLVGALWVTIGVAVAEWRLSRKSCPAMRPGKWVRTLGLSLVLGLTGLAAVNVWRFDDPRNAPVQTVDQILPDNDVLASIGGLPSLTESLMGSPLDSVSLVVLARDETALSDAMRASGWTASRLPSAGIVLDAVFAAIEGKADPTVETVSHFWRGQPNDLAFVHVSQAEVSWSFDDPKARFWQTEYVTRNGLRAFFGTVGVDEVKDALSGRPAAAEMAPRDALAQSLRAHGAADATQSVVVGQGGGTASRANSDVVVLSLR